MSLIKMKRASADRWAQLNPILADGEPGYDETNNQVRIGNDIDRWLELEPLGFDASAPVTFQDLEDHINSLTPHPVYDDGPSFQLLYESAKV